MQLLHNLAPAQGWHLVVGHCNHQWREDAAANAEHVARLAHKLGVAYHQVSRCTTTHVQYATELMCQCGGALELELAYHQVCVPLLTNSKFAYHQVSLWATTHTLYTII